MGIGEDGHLTRKVYNKTDDFNFNVIHYGSADSNVSQKIGPRVFYSEIIRFGRITNCKINFIDKIKKCFNIFKSNGFEQIELLSKIELFSRNYKGLLLKFGIFTEKERLEFINLFL